MFSFSSFMVSRLTFKSLVHFEFIFVYGIKKNDPVSFFCILSLPLSLSKEKFYFLFFPSCISSLGLSVTSSPLT